MKPYSKDLRLRVLAAVDRGMARKEVSRIFGVSEPTIRRYLRLRRQTGDVDPKPPSGPPARKGAALDEALDEPAAGMNAAEKMALGELLLRIRDDGKTLLMIEHDVKLVMGICDRLMVLDYGKTLTSGTPDTVRRDPAVIAAWLGGNIHV